MLELFHSIILISAETDFVAVVVDWLAFFDELPVVECVEILVEDFRTSVCVNFGDIRRVAIGQKRAIHHRASYDVNLFEVVFFERRKQFVKGFDKDISFLFCVLVVTVWIEDDIRAVFEWHTVRQREKRVASHNDNLVFGVRNEMAHIFFERKQQAVLLAQSPFVVNCKYCFHFRFFSDLVRSRATADFLLPLILLALRVTENLRLPQCVFTLRTTVDLRLFACAISF